MVNEPHSSPRHVVHYNFSGHFIPALKYTSPLFSHLGSSSQFYSKQIQYTPQYYFNNMALIAIYVYDLAQFMIFNTFYT